MEPCRDVNSYLNKGVHKLIADILQATLRNPGETAFLRKLHSRQKRMEETRQSHEARGVHIPTFLIASITGACNLACKGCYARANGLCGDRGCEGLLPAERWGELFGEAEEAGIPFVLLAGGEPLLRMDVLKKAAEHEGILFPIFTNGTLLDAQALRLLTEHRNLKPVISLEGGQISTDGRRGEGTHRLVQNAMDALMERKLLFGVSLTVTTENLAEITSRDFLLPLYAKGCRAIFFVEYVPVAPGTEHLAPGDGQRLELEIAQAALRKELPGMIFLSFPGDEKYMGGCLAAGRGFFHINPHGGAEPCPFSPYSDISLKDHTLLEALMSPFFQKVREMNERETEHAGGCTLFAREAQVRGLLFPGISG